MCLTADYCLKMENGLYYDPWNPWCGFIECQDGVATRKVCEPYTWMGMGMTNILSVNKNDMCRKRLASEPTNLRCPETTEFAMCEDTKGMEATGSPKNVINTLQGLTSALKQEVKGANQSTVSIILYRTIEEVYNNLYNEWQMVESMGNSNVCKWKIKLRPHVKSSF